MKITLTFRFSSALLFGMFAVSTLRAQDSTSSFSVHGYVDTYYQYNLNKPTSNFNQGRIFDVRDGSFSVGLVQTALTYTTDKSEFVADLTFGPNADLGNFGNLGTGLTIKQAYFAYNISGKLKMSVGQFGTHIGYELIDAPANANYSLSYLFGNGPFYATGIKFDYALSDKFAFMAGVVNGWDALSDFNDAKSIILQAVITPSEKLSLFLNWKGGDESNGASNFGTYEGSYTGIFDLTGAYQASKNLLVGVNAAYGTFSTGAKTAVAGNAWSEDATWYGAALYLNYAVSDKFSLNFRGEHFNDEKGLRYFGP